MCNAIKNGNPLMRSSRNIAVDIFKLVAAFGVIIIHMQPSTNAAAALSNLFSLFAVPFFLLISLYYFIKKVNSTPSLSAADLHLDRILVPYLIWTLIYTLMRMLKYRSLHQPLSIDLIGIIIFGGGAVQLYFIPLLLLFQAVALSLILSCRVSRQRIIGICTMVGVFAFSEIGSARGHFGFGQSFQNGVVYVLLAFLMVYAQGSQIGRRINGIVGVLVTVLIFTTAFFGYPLNYLGTLQGGISGYGVSALALNLPLYTEMIALRTMLTCSYGIYLAHVGFVEAIEFLSGRFGYALAPYTLLAKTTLGSLIFFLCLLLIWLVRYNSLSAYLFLGESDKYSMLDRIRQHDPLANKPPAH